jgi:phosphate transport system substrate-binding protein
MKKRDLLIITFCILAVVVYAAASHATKEIIVHPGGQLPLGGFDDVVAAFEKETGIKVSYPQKIGGCGDSVKGVASGSINAGIMCCPANKDETGKLGFVDSAVARDALQFIVEKSNPVSDLTTRQLRDIYQGKIKNWKEVGGNDAPIVPYSHVMCGNREEVARQFLTGVRKSGTITIDNGKFAPWLSNVGDETKVPDTVAADPNGIGWVSRSMNKDNVKVLSVDGVMPTPETIANETYPIVRYLHVVTKGYPTGATRQFIDYVKSKEGQTILARQGKIIPLP